MASINKSTTLEKLVKYLKIIDSLISSGDEVEIVTSGSTGKKFKIPFNTKNNESLKKLKDCINKTKSIGVLKDEIKEIRFFTGTRDPKKGLISFPLSSFSKPSLAAGGGGAKGRYTEVLSESFFCVYASFCRYGNQTQWKKFKELSVPFLTEKGKPYKWSNFKTWVNKNGIKGLELALASPDFKSGFDAEQNSFFRQDMKSDGISPWHKAIVKQAEKIKPYLTKSNYKFVRADNIPEKIKPYDVYKIYGDLLKKKIGFKSTLDPDKWNPADVWIYEEGKMVTVKKLMDDIEKKFPLTEKKNTKITNITLLDGQVKKEYTIANPAIFDLMNEQIYDLAMKKLVIPVSLKKPGQTAYLKEMNKKDSEIEETFTFTGITFSPTNVDVQLKFKLTYRNKKDPKKVPSPSSVTGFLKMKSFSGGLRLEITFDGFSARMGSIGTENYSFIIYMTDKTGIKMVEKLRGKNNHNLTEKVGLQFSSTPEGWFGGLKYKALSEPKQKLLKNYVIDLYDAIHKKEGKTVATGAEDLKNQKDGKWIANKAASGEVGLAIGGMEKKKAEKAVKAIFSLASSQGFYVPGNANKNTQIMNSCYHIKLY